MRVIGVHPSVKVCLQLFYRGVYLLSESDGVEFVLDSPVEAFTDAVCLRALGLDLGMVHVACNWIHIYKYRFDSVPPQSMGSCHKTIKEWL